MAPLFTGSKLGFGRVDAAAGPTGPFSATGGTKTESGGYTLHAFTSVGPSSFIVENAPPTFSVELLIVAGGGGGGGGYSSGGGGGAGGLLYYGPTPGGAGASIPLSSGNYSVVVGAGGSNNYPGPGTLGTKGGDSSFSSYTSFGGGVAKGPNPSPDKNGGSGAANGSGTPGQGNPGGSSVGSFDGAGGGGAGGAGSNGTGGAYNNSRGGPGGIGKQYAQFGPTYGTPGPNGVGYFAGGGGGGAYSDAGVQTHPGGAGGGGYGQSGSFGTGVPGTANTGGGGGAGGAANNQDGAAGNGGPGIVIIRYLV